MNKYQDAFEYVLVATNGGDGMVAQLKTLEELVDKAMPKKPNHVAIIKGLLGRYECPICGHQIHFIQGDREPNEMDKYCSDCGQAIDSEGII